MQEEVTTQAASGWSWIPTSEELLQYAEDNMLEGNEKSIFMLVS